MVSPGPDIGNAICKILAINDLAVFRLAKSQETQDSLKRFRQIRFENRIAFEGSDFVVRQERRVRIELTRLWKREHPLDEVVDRFEVIVAPTPNLSKRPPLIVRPLTTIETQ